MSQVDMEPQKKMGGDGETDHAGIDAFGQTGD